MPEYDDFQEIANSGGRVTFHLACSATGVRSYAQGIQHNSPTPAAWVGIYALVPQGIPVADFRIGGIGQGFDPLPPQGCTPVFLMSDSQGRWGHQCQKCNGYFRNGVHPAIYPLTCPYCGIKADSFNFLTSSQRVFVRHYVNTLLESLDAEMENGTEREFVIDMDAIASQNSDQPKPEFYFSAETQQTRYDCDHCGDFNDIRGRFGYCSSCGWRNNLQSLKRTLAILREQLNTNQISPENATRTSVSEFDSCCRDIATQIRKRIPMKANINTEFERLIFHDIESPTIALMKSRFDIDILDGLNGNRTFIKLMMHRRHVFEHNAGVTDQRYIRESGDITVAEGVLIRETQENVHRLIGCLTRMVENFDRDFHEILVPTSWPIEYRRRQQT